MLQKQELNFFCHYDRKIVGNFFLFHDISEGYCLNDLLVPLCSFRGTDNLILAGHVEGDSAMLEVYIYNDVEDALYVHHDILLPSLPLALGKKNSTQEC